jgi:hypothetical protein
LIEARLGNFTQALQYLTENITRSLRHGMGGINLGVAYEFRARVAIWMKDEEAFARDAELCAEHYHAGGGSPELTARMEALFAEARKHGVVEAHWQSRELSPTHLTHAQVELRDRLVDCQDAASRYLQTLLAIAQSANCPGGFFFANEGEAVVLLAMSEDCTETPAVRALAERILAATHASGEVTETAAELTRTESDHTASVTGGVRAELCEGFLPQQLSTARSPAVLGIFLLHVGDELPRSPDTELLDLAADFLLSAGDLAAAPG